MLVLLLARRERRERQLVAAVTLGALKGTECTLGSIARALDSYWSKT